MNREFECHWKVNEQVRLSPEKVVMAAVGRHLFGVVETKGRFINSHLRAASSDQNQVTRQLSHVTLSRKRERVCEALRLHCW